MTKPTKIATGEYTHNGAKISAIVPCRLGRWAIVIPGQDKWHHTETLREAVELIDRITRQMALHAETLMQAFVDRCNRTVKVEKLTGLALDWAVAKCEKESVTLEVGNLWLNRYRYSPSTDWSVGGPIIERERIALRAYDHDVQPWSAEQPLSGMSAFSTGPTALVAAMRCYVASKLGDEVELPSELVA
jgi:hypothetical protein